MKKTICTTAIMLLLIAFSFGQATTKMTKEGKPDMRVKANKEAAKVTKTTEVKTTATSTKSTGVNKDGTPDMRLKANKMKKAEAPVVAKSPAPAAATKTTTVTTVPVTKTVTTSSKSSSTTTSSTDKVVGTDAKGRTIYEGPRGGHYYINKNGNKEYVKK